MAMTPAEIAAERRRGRLAGVAAIGSALLFPAGVLWSGVVNADQPENNRPAELRFYDRHAEELVASTVLRSLGFALLIITAVFLYRATKARNPDLNRIVLVTGVVGPAALALGTLGQSIYLAFASSDFAGREFQTIDAAKDVSTAPLSLFFVGLSIAGTLGVAFWLVVGSLNAMRVGLLSRFLGVVGMLVGVGFVVVPAIFFSSLWLLWLLGIGAVLLGLNPRGRPPAWDLGEARPWPSASERSEAAEAAQAAAASGSRNGDVEAIGPGVRKPGGETSPTPASSPGGTRRKRKRRR